MPGVWALVCWLTSLTDNDVDDSCESRPVSTADVINALAVCETGLSAIVLAGTVALIWSQN